MGLITYYNDFFVNWTKFEQNWTKNKRFEIFLPGLLGTPDSRRTFFKIALISLTVVQSSIFQQIPVGNVPNF
jgi:hypothetical protein